MKKILLVTEEVNIETEKNLIVQSSILDFQKNAKLTVFCLRKGSFPEADVEVKIIGGKTKFGKMWKFLKLCIVDRKSYDSVLVDRNPEYVLLAGILWFIMGKSVSLYYSHRHLGLATLLLALCTKKVYTPNAYNRSKVFTFNRVTGMPDMLDMLNK